MKEVSGRPAPPRGAGLFLFCLVLPWGTGCGDGPPEGLEPLVELARELDLPAGAHLHRVTLGGRGAEEHAVPAVVEAQPGDAVAFLTVDHRVHTVSFPADSLSAEVQLFLQASGQGNSPPLVNRGSQYVLFLEGAPEGRYPFQSEGHGGVARGVIIVGPVLDTLPSPSG